MKDIVNTLEKKDRPELNKFDWQDPLLLDNKLSDNERLLVKSVREFADKNLSTKVEKAFQTEQFDREVLLTDDYYNGIISCKIGGQTVKYLKENYVRNNL